MNMNLFVPSDLHTRAATESDEPAVQALSEAAFTDLRKIYRPTIAALAQRSNLPSEPQRVVAVDDSGQIVGTTKYYRDGDCYRILALAVPKEHRHRGIARRLIDHVATLARMEGCSSVRLYTIRETGNVAVFERIGFHLVSERPDILMESVMGGPLMEVDMVREISNEPLTC